MNNKPTVLCIVGPTACGKTDLSVKLALEYNGEIVSADAVAVYRGLDIGSAKPSESERKGVVHHLIDCVEITDENFSVSTFRTLARNAIDSIRSRGMLPIVVGGSGLYVDSIFSDLRFTAPFDPVIRSALETEYDQDQSAVFEQLKESDPVTALRLHRNDKKRVVRALEVFRLTGIPMSQLNQSFESVQQQNDMYRTVWIGLNTDRSILYDRINRRVDQMVTNGLQNEAYTLFDKGYTPDRYHAMQSIGYAQLYDAYLGNCTLTEAVERIKLDTRHFAKRQMTWFKRNPNIQWFDPYAMSLDKITEQITELMK